MKTLIAAATLALASTAMFAGETQMTDADWAALHTLNLISPAKHTALMHVAGECHVVPNTDALLMLLAAPVVANAKPAMGHLPTVTPQICASLARR